MNKKFLSASRTFSERISSNTNTFVADVTYYD